VSAATATPDVDGIELRIARDLARRAVLIAPFVIVALGLWRGLDAALAAVLALALVAGNWLLAAAMLGWAARVNPSMLMAVALFGFIFRLLLITGISLGIKELDIVDWPVYCGVLLAGYAGLLIWELRHVSFSLASPGLKPKTSVPSGRVEKGNS
jgi:hypothetical protein